MNNRIAEKIESIMGKTKRKLRLTQVSSDHRFKKKFQKRFDDFKDLKTFVDSKEQMSQANILNNRDLLHKIQQYMTRKKLKNIIDNHRKKGSIVELQNDPLFKELQYEQDRKLLHNFETRNIDFGHITTQTKQPSIILEEYAEAKAILKMAHGSISDRVYKIRDRHQSHFSLPSINQQTSDYEGNQFYQSIESQLHNIDKRIIDQQMKSQRNLQEQERLQNEQDKMLRRVVKQYGIDLSKNLDQILEDQQFHRAFKRNSQDVINETIKKAKINQEEKIKQKSPSKIVRLSHIIEKSLNRLKEAKKFTNIQSKLNLKSVEKRGSSLPTQEGSIVDEKSILTLLSQKSLIPHKQEVRQFHAKWRHFNESLVPDELEEKRENVLLQNDLNFLEQSIDELQERTEFNQQLKDLGFKMEPMSVLRLGKQQDGALRRLEKKKHARAMRIIRYNY